MEKIFIPENFDIKQMSLITLAHYGDAVHTLFVRSRFIQSGVETAGNLHKVCSKFCSASAQSQALDKIADILDQNEKNLVRRARNTKTHKPPKSCDLEVYKKATAFEVVVGYLTLCKNFERLNLFLVKSVEN